MNKLLLSVFTLSVFLADQSLAGTVYVDCTVHRPEGSSLNVDLRSTGPDWVYIGTVQNWGTNDTKTVRYLTDYFQSWQLPLVYTGAHEINAVLTTSPWTAYSQAGGDYGRSVYIPEDSSVIHQTAAFYVGLIPPAFPQESSRTCEDGSTDDPIDTRNGNTYFSEQRIFIPCPGVSLELDLKYQSVSDMPAGGLGRGWRHGLEWALDIQTNQAVLYTGSGMKKIFGKGENGAYHSPDDSNWTLEAIPSGYEVVMSGGLACTFDAHGVLSAIQDAWGNGITCSYGTNACLESVTHSNGRQILFSNRWHAAGSQWRPASISVPGGVSLDFGFNDDGQLAQVVERVGSGSYTSHYQYAGGFLTNKVNGAGSAYTFGYEAGTNGLPNGKGIHLDVDGYYEHTVEYVDPDITDVRYSLRGVQQLYRYSRDREGMLATRHGPGTNVTEAVVRGVDYSYSPNKADRTETTLFDYTTGASWSEWLQYDGAHNATNYSVSYCTTNPVQLVSMKYDPVWQLPARVMDADGSRMDVLYTNGSPRAVKTFVSESNSYDTLFTYTANGLISSITNANGHAVNYAYDSAGNRIRMAAGLGPVVTNTYDALGFVQGVEILTESGASSGRSFRFDRDAKGRVTDIVFPDGLTSSNTYNALGYLMQTIDRAGRRIDYTYAPAEKLTSVTRYLRENDADIPARISYTLDEQVNVLSITEPRGRYVESYRLDLQDRAASITNIEGQVMNVGYSIGDFISRVTRFDGTVITNAYDSAGRLSSAVYRIEGAAQPSTGITCTYCPDGLLKTMRDGCSSVSNAYDRLNRLTSSSLSTACPFTVDYRYDPLGNITNTVVSCGGSQIASTAYTYDRAERLVEIAGKDTETHHFVYAYDPASGRIASISNTLNGITCSYRYNLMNLPTNMVYTAGDGSLIRELAYAFDAAGMIKRKTDVQDGGPTRVSSYICDSLDRLVHESRTVEDQASLPARTITCTYDLAGNRTGKHEDSLCTTYNLGAGNRLDSTSTSASNLLFITGTSSEPIGMDPRWGERWITNLTAEAAGRLTVNGYSFLGEVPALAGSTNRIHVAVPDQAGNMAYCAGDFFVESDGGAAAVSSYAYDAAGCITNLSGMTLEWDLRYRLRHVVSSSGGSVEYGYDVLGRRVSRTGIPPEGGTANIEYYIYDGGQVVADLDENMELLRTYVWGHGIDTLLCFTDHTASNTYYAIRDHQNSVIALVDETGSVVEGYAYDAWGNVLDVLDGSGHSTGSRKSEIGNRYTFQGREMDWATGLYCFRARWYDPETGRWLSKDPIGIEGGLNQYVFCDNNPVTFTDPGGLDVAYLIDWDVLGGAGHGAAAVGNDNAGWTYYSFGPGSDFTDTSDNLDIKHYESYQALLNDNTRYNGNVRYPTSRDADRAAHAEALSSIGQKYNLFRNNCDDIAVAILRAAGIKLSDHWMPSETFGDLPEPCKE